MINQNYRSLFSINPIYKKVFDYKQQPQKTTSNQSLNRRNVVWNLTFYPQNQKNHSSQISPRMYNLLKVLEIIIQSYSRLSMKQLFQNYLAVNVFILTNTEVAKQFFKRELKLGNAKQQIFFKGRQSSSNQSNLYDRSRATSKKQIAIYVAINHQKMLPLHKSLMGIKSKQQKTNNLYHNFGLLQNLICLTKNGQVFDNIFSVDEKIAKIHSESQIKGLFLVIPYENQAVQFISDQISLYLSIAELFHSHIAMALSIYPIDDYSHLLNMINLSLKEFQQDDDELLTNSSYCRIFQALPFKITYDQVALLGDIDTNYWGETIRIEQGIDGLIFWILFNHSPVLLNQDTGKSQQKLFRMSKLSLSQKQSCQRLFLKMGEQNYGHIVLKDKRLIKQPIQNLSMTILIVNIKKSEYCCNIDKIFGQVFQNELKRFKNARTISKDYSKCQKVNGQIERLCNLLVDVPQDYRYFNEGNQKNNTTEAKQLAYSVNKWLFIDNEK